jgi:hypothetical protein
VFAKAYATGLFRGKFAGMPRGAGELFPQIRKGIARTPWLISIFAGMSQVRKYNLEELEQHYRRLTTQGDIESAQRMQSIIANIRYDLANKQEVFMEYTEGMDTPLVMRILKTEKDLDRWVEQRFIRLGEYT